jgi:methylase of polypeptide subunit release factors
MTSKLALNQTAKWIQKLSVACDGDVSHAGRQLAWLKEKVIADRQGEIDKRSFESLTQPEQEQLDKYVNERYLDHKPLQYILGAVICLS